MFSQQRHTHNLTWRYHSNFTNESHGFQGRSVKYVCFVGNEHRRKKMIRWVSSVSSQWQTSPALPSVKHSLAPWSPMATARVMTLVRFPEGCPQGLDWWVHFVPGFSSSSTSSLCAFSCVIIIIHTLSPFIHLCLTFRLTFPNHPFIHLLHMYHTFLHI